MNNEGYLFRLDQWAAEIAGKSKNTFVVLMNDYQNDDKHLSLEQTTGDIISPLEAV